MTPQQLKLLRFIRNSIVHNHRGPTYKEMRDHMGVSSNQTIIDWLVALKKQGYLRWEQGKESGINIHEDIPKKEKDSSEQQTSQRRDPNEFTAKVKETLAKRAAQSCSNCNRATSGPHSEKGKSVNIGKAAHICGKQPGTARYDEKMSPEQRSDIANAIWLCGNCHDLIDRDEKEYTVEKLKTMKEKHEQKVRESMLSAFGIRDIGFIATTTTAEVLDDPNIKKSFEAWGKGDFSAAYDYAQDAYFAGGGEIKLQAIANMILFGEQQLQRATYYIALCDEGIALAKSLNDIQTGAVLKAHKAYFLQNRAFRNSLQVYEETQLRRIGGFPSRSNAELSRLIEAVNQDGKEIDKLVHEAHAEAIKGNSYSTLAHVKMTIGNVIGLTYIFTKQLGGDTGKIEHFTIRMLTEAKEIYEKLKDEDGVGNALHNLANNLRFFGDIKRAKAYATQAQQIAKKTGNKELEIKSTELLKDRLEGGQINL
jgi:hypothetical protein